MSWKGTNLNKEFTNSEDAFLLVSALRERMYEEINGLTLLQQKELEEMNVPINGIFQEIELETLKIVKQYAEFYVQRYEESGKKLMKVDPEKFKYLVRIKRFNPDGTLTDQRKLDQFCMGATQKAFEITLQQLQVSYIPNDPTIDWRPKQDIDLLDNTTKFRYDFFIPLFGTIDIKCATLKPGWNRVNINCREFNEEEPDYVVAYKILDISKPKWLKLIGFMKNEEIRKYKPVETSRSFWSIPIEDFHEAEKLVDVLLKTRALIYRLHNERIQKSRSN
jgi:hypothetical protein